VLLSGLFALVVFSALGPQLVCAQTPTLDVSFNPGADGDVNLLAIQADTKILLGGGFANLAGQPRTYLGRVNTDGTLNTGFNPGPDGQVHALAVQPNGQILVGGSFGALGGQACHNLGRLNADGTLDSAFDPEPDLYVTSLALQPDGKILVGGLFNTLGGQARAKIGRLNPDGTLDSGFNPGANDEVDCLILQPDGRILVSGWFTVLAGQPRTYLGRLNADGSLDDGLDLAPTGNVDALALQADGKILLGGCFSALGGQPYQNLARLNADGTLDSGFNPEPTSCVSCLALQADGKILVGGGFTMLGGQIHNYLGRLNADGTVDDAFDPPYDGPVSSLAIQADGEILEGGLFFGLDRLNSAEPATLSLDYDGTTITWLRGGTSPEVWRTSFDGSTNGADWSPLGEGSRVPGGWQLTSVSLPSGSIIRARGWVCGGGSCFSSCGGGSSSWFVEAYLGMAPVLVLQPADRTNDALTTATFSAAAIGSEPFSFRWLKNAVPLVDSGSIAGATTTELMVSNVLAGDSGGYNVVVSNAFGGLTSAVARLTVMDPSIAVQPTAQIGQVGQSVTFSVTAAGTTPFGYQWFKDGAALAGVTGSSATLTNLQVGDAGSYHVVVSNRYGSATSAAAQLTVNPAALDSSFNLELSALAEGGYSYPAVFSLALLPDGKVLVAGEFTVPGRGGSTLTNLARLSTDGTVDSGPNPGVGGWTSMLWVDSLAVQGDGTILVDGEFSTLGGQTCHDLGRLNADGTVDGGFNPAPLDPAANPGPLALQTDGKIVLSGEFDTVGGQTHSGLARLNADGTLDSGFDAGVAGGVGVFTLAVQADGKILVGGDFTMLDGRSCTNLGRLNPDGTLDVGFHPGSEYPVLSLALQADGKILVGGTFTALAGEALFGLARLNADGTMDSGFNPEVSGHVQPLALQANGKILVGGSFTALGGQTCNNLGRLNADGTPDSSFNPGANGTVMSLALQPDGKVLAGGSFSMLAGQDRAGLGRINNADAATQSLSFDGSTITWLRGGASPEVWRTTFDVSTNAADWTPLGAGTRIAGGWQLGPVRLPVGGAIRARGYVTGGGNGSCWFVESLLSTLPRIIVDDGHFGFGTNGFGFNLLGTSGQTVVVEGSTNLVDWLPLQTNTLGNSSAYFSDPVARGASERFYRARVLR
jgi:uncharacterized delta-60 repeat protein